MSRPGPLLDVALLLRPPHVRVAGLALAAGEIAVLSGPSGSGKTLLLRALADLDPAEEARVTLDGRPRDAFPAGDWRRQVLLVSQGGPTLAGTVREDLARVAGLERQRDHAAALERAAAACGLSPDAETAHLSGGEAAALGVARALAVDPRVLLLDEPTAALDPERAATVERAVREWVDAPGASRAALWISHDPALPGRLGARALALADLATAAADAADDAAADGARR